MKKINYPYASLLLAAFLSISGAVAGDDQDKCVYTLYVRTGSIIRAGTDARVSISLGDAAGSSAWIPNLKHWGIMGRDHDYFERGQVDIFTGLGRCVGRPICRLNVTSDGSGIHSGWFLDYVDVSATGPHMGCTKSLFHVGQWLSLDIPPYRLTVEIDECEPRAKREGGRESQLSLVLG